MTASPELMLATAIVLLYLYDGIELLAVNELVLLREGSRWSYRFPSRRWQWRNGLLYLPNPLRPDQDAFIVTWTAAAARPNGDPALIADDLPALRPLRWLVRLLFLLVVVLLPALFIARVFVQVSDTVVLAVLATMYATLVGTAFLLIRRRQRLGLSWKRALVLAAECLLCPPFAVNLLRKLSSRSGRVADPVAFARGRMRGPVHAGLVSGIIERIDEQLAFVDPESDRFRRLRACRDHVEALQA